MIDTVGGYVSQGFDNLQRNVYAYGSMSIREWLRIVVIVGAYLLLRPYLTKGAAKIQADRHAKEMDPEEMVNAKAERAVISANSLRGQVQLPEESDSDEAEVAEAAGTGANWGKKARKRQRQMIKRIIEADEKLRRETEAFDDEEDKDIEQYLT